MSDMDQKLCSTCSAALPTTEFYKDRSRPDGLRSACRRCHDARTKAYGVAHSVEVAAYQKAYRFGRREQVKAYNKAYYAAHPLEAAAQHRLARARRSGATIFGDIPVTVIADLKVLYGPYCLFPGCDETEIQIDHVVSLKHHGSHTADNFQLLCGFHNNSKGTKTIDYRPRGTV